MINFPWHVDFGAGVATTLVICAITALSHDQGHTGFHGRFRRCFSSGLPSKIKQSIRVDNAVGDPHDCTSLLPLILDAVRRGVLCTLLALAIGSDSFVVGVRAGAEVAASPRLVIYVIIGNGKIKLC